MHHIQDIILVVNYPFKFGGWAGLLCTDLVRSAEVVVVKLYCLIYVKIWETNLIIWHNIATFLVSVISSSCKKQD